MSAGLYDYARNRDFQRWCEQWAREALRVLKPGGHIFCFGGTRTFHRLTCGIEDAGFEIRNVAAWLFGSGFPKSRNLKLDMLSLPRSTAREGWRAWWRAARVSGTDLKPAWEPIVVGRKPLAGTVAQNVLAHGTGALNIDAGRVGAAERPVMVRTDTVVEATAMAGESTGATASGETTTLGRWPANVVLDEEAAAQLDAQVGPLAGGTPRRAEHGAAGAGVTFIAGHEHSGFGDQGGGPSRFFYTAKASRSEREAGLEELEPARRSDGRAKDIENPRLRTSERRNDHPTVKPVDLMRWLVRLGVPPGGVVLDPFMGSGTTGMAALDEGFAFVGIDREAKYVGYARRRIAHRHLLAPTKREPSAELIQGALIA